MVENKQKLAKSFGMIDNSMEKMWDMWLVSLGSLASTQEQIENMTRKQLDQNKAAREELAANVRKLEKRVSKDAGGLVTAARASEALGDNLKARQYLEKARVINPTLRPTREFRRINPER